MCSENPPAVAAKGGFIGDGISEELDELRHIIRNSKEILVEIQRKEIKATGIANLKIGFNNVFGYYLEVTNRYKNQGMVPDHWVRKQTLTNSERYITDELKTLESKILNAEDKIQELEIELFEKLIAYLLDYVQTIQENARLVGRLDCLQSFAWISKKYNYARPQIVEESIIDIKQGRHPVIERHLPPGEAYIPNDIFLDNENEQILMITGPNMSGKSAVLRQTALICLMAQMGCFVPAKSVSMGIVDKVFTRVGASDNISSGESTFMVEMNETASIMNNISENSLILLDEIGRGTSTYDGISIAWSLAEFLHSNSRARPKTLFATHYHELNELTHQYPRIKNYHIATREVGEKVIFLRTLKPGGSNHSFGIHVAKMAGMPKEVVDRANEILVELESKAFHGTVDKDRNSETLRSIPSKPMQLNIFEATDEEAQKIKQDLVGLDVDRMTPVECMMKIMEWRKMIE
jgi:DNA mismatch repair protein MutS